MLNFLVQTDKLWNRQQMSERAREVFLRVHLAEDATDPAEAPIADLFPAPAAALQERIRERQASGVAIEYRNLCVRKAELILVRNFADRTKDEFTVRISAHAQKVVRKGDRVLSEQPYVTPFEEYWTFGRLDERWKLKEVLPPARGENLIGAENVDEDSSPEQLKWYYRQTRAI
jgi:predicted lipid-binding transport protein (Tim44 family)